MKLERKESKDEKNGFHLKAVLLNGKEVGYGFKNADTWFYVSPLTVPGVYEGKTLYRNLLFKSWYPNRVVMTDENIFTASDDARNSCGPTTNVYVRKEPRPKAATATLPKSGSGFLLRDTDFVMTAYHVVKDAKQIEVRFPSGVSYVANIASRDISNDLAVLKLREFKSSEDGFKINPNSSVSAGDRVHALGFPLARTLGEQPSIVSGEVSAITGIDDSPTQFRMTALINSGNSGGPILNQNGEVVGVVVGSLVGRSVEGVNFGIKISTTLPLLHQAGLKVDDWKQDRPMTAREIFGAFSKYVVLVKVNGN